MSAAWDPYRAAVQGVVADVLAADAQDAWLSANLAARIALITGAAPASDLLAWLRADEDVSFIVHDAPRGVCAKPPELVHALLDALIRELVAEGGGSRP